MTNFSAKFLDPTRGKPEEEQIVMTTVFRTKGLEYDYVFIPDCDEGYMPCLFGTGNLVFDKAGIVKEPEPSEVIENERRLFYVAITRARKGVFIGTSVPPAGGSQSKSSPSRPSRFMYEIQHEPTGALMTSLQKLAAGDQSARSEIQHAVAQYGGMKGIIHNLVTAYLPAIGEQDFAGELRSLAAQRPTLPFRYPQPYENALPSVAPQPEPTWDTVEPPWWEADEGF